MELIGCTVCEMFAFKVYCDRETGVRGHSTSSKVALFDRAHTTLYSSSIVIMPLSITVSEIQPHIGRKSLPPCIWRPRWGWSRQIYAKTLGGEKLEWWAYQTVEEFRWYIQLFWYKSCMWHGRTDGIGVAYTRYSIYAVAHNKIKKPTRQLSIKCCFQHMLFHCDGVTSLTFDPKFNAFISVT